MYPKFLRFLSFFLPSWVLNHLKPLKSWIHFFFWVMHQFINLVSWTSLKVLTPELICKSLCPKPIWKSWVLNQFVGVMFITCLKVLNLETICKSCVLNQSKSPKSNQSKSPTCPKPIWKSCVLNQSNSPTYLKPI